MSSNCSKCGIEVPPHNNATLLAIDMCEVDPRADSKHLLPVYENGQLLCVGCPSIAQYLPDQPLDTRQQFRYQNDREEFVRTHHAKFLKKYPVPVC